MQNSSPSIYRMAFCSCRLRGSFGRQRTSPRSGMAMRFDIIKIFPEIFGTVFDFGIIRRAVEAKLIEISIHDLRDYTYDRHRQVDDRPFGGGAGMVMKPEPLFRA